MPAKKPKSRAGKLFLLLILLIVGIPLYFGITGNDGPRVVYRPPSVEGAKNAMDVEGALSALKSEQKIKDVLYQEGMAIEWNIGVLPDGGPRVGFAQYVCEVLREHAAVQKETWVRVVDITKVTRGENLRDADLGRVNCQTFEKIFPGS